MDKLLSVWVDEPNLGILAEVGGFGEMLAAGLFIIGAALALKGMLRIAWLRLGGADQPIRTYLRGRFGG
jgi:hypothetical protein